MRAILKLLNITTPHEKKRLAVCAAVRSRRIIQFYYHGISLTVEPYRLGMVLSGGPKNDSLLCYQIRGFISPEETPGWKLYRLMDITDIEILDEQFEGDRPDYDPNSVYMHIAYCSIFPMPRVESESSEEFEVEPESASEETPNSIPASTIEELTDISLKYAAKVESYVSPVYPAEEMTDIEPVFKAEEASDVIPVPDTDEKAGIAPMTTSEEMSNIILLPAPKIIPESEVSSPSHNKKMKEFRLNHPSINN